MYDVMTFNRRIRVTSQRLTDRTGLDVAVLLLDDDGGSVQLQDVTYVEQKS